MKLVEIFEKIPDYRVLNRTHHNLSEILVISLCAVVSGADDFEDIEEYGHQKKAFLQERLGLELINGVPSHDTFNRVFRHLNKRHLEESLRKWTKDIIDNLVEHQINVDGKVLKATGKRGKKTAALCLVNAWLSDHSISLGQVKVSQKSNEKTAIPELINTIDTEGALVSIDAMGCQKSIAELIVNDDNKADYLLALKKNNKRLYKEVEDWMNKHKLRMDTYQQIDYVGGRIEKRTTYVTQNLVYIDELTGWKGVKSLIMIESERKYKNGEQKDTFQTRYYISSKGGQSEYFGSCIRKHWGIENQLHWYLDVVFNEDRQRVREGNAPDNMAILRKMALQILVQNKGKSSVKKVRKRAAWNNDFLAQIITTF